MVDLEAGHLFKKIHVMYKSEKYVIFEFVDYVLGISFINSMNEMKCSIATGNNVGVCACHRNNYTIDNEFLFIKDDIKTAIKRNHGQVNFSEIRKNEMMNNNKFYFSDANGQNMIEIKDSKLISHLRNEQLSFDEKELKKDTDISSIYSSIKKTIISQDEQIMKILTAIFKNQTIVESDLDIDIIAKLKENILVYGSTGTGKTEILKRLSKLYNIPLVIEDATSLAETGYVGRKITDMLADLILAADGDIELAQKGILVIDEFDKLAEKNISSQDHVSRIGVQRSLLKLLDGSTFYFEDKNFDTSKLTVVGLGAFTGITDGDNYKDLTNDDLIKYGIMRELLGRFSKTIHMNPLKKEDIIKILKESDFSPLNTYKKLFEILKVNFEFDDEFVEYIAELALTKQSGARSLKTVFDECISSALFRIFAGEYSNISLVKPSEENSKPYVLTKVIKK